MAVLDANGSKAGSLVAAAMESAGISVQADMLLWVKGDSGMILAGLLFLLGIYGAIFSIAAGGQYIWGRYLLVGPALFLFLVNTTATSNGTKWEFHDHAFSEEHVQEALRDTGYEGRGDVSLFFQFWNNFTSAATQELIGLLNLTQDGSHLDFLSKVERYMRVWISAGNIPDPRLQQFVRLVMVNECADYYSMLMAIADIHVDSLDKTEYRRRIEEMREVPRFFVNKGAPRAGTDMERDLVERGVLEAGASYTCDELWNLAIKALQEPGAEQLAKILQSNLSADQTLAQTTQTLVEKVGTQTSRATGQVAISEGQLLHAVHWLIMKSLWTEMTDSNGMREYYNTESHGGYFASAPKTQAMPIQNSGTATNSGIRQFNRTETYQFKGDFVNAALSMPYFQGVGLFLLAAAYPFFAMAMVMPGKAGAILTWMGLWAWLKLWDLGFAVVFMIDNILYTMFPRGPAISEEDLTQPGIAFMKLLEQDPTYSSAVYYNIIAVCLFAVPIVTGVFVKGAGRQFIGMLRDAWKSHASRLGASAASYARAAQGQSYVQQQRLNEANLVAQAMQDMENSEWFQQQAGEHAALGIISGSLDEAGNFSSEIAKKSAANKGLLTPMERMLNLPGLKGATGALTTHQKALIDQQQQLRANAMTSALSAYGALKEYQHSAGPGGWHAAESAVAAKYYTHDTATDYPTQAVLGAMLSQQYIGQEKISGATGDQLSESAGNFFSGLFPAGGSSGGR